MTIEFKISKKELIVVLLSLFVLLFYFLILPVYPYFLFDKDVQKNNITIYYNNDFEKEKLVEIIEETTNKLKDSYFFNENIESDVFICNHKLLYILLNPFNIKGFASNRVRYKNIFVANADPKNNSATSLFKKSRTEKLTNLLAHEINHGYVKESSSKRLTEWKDEGYSEYIAYDRTMDLKKEYNDSLNPNYWYIKRKSLVYFLLNIKKININEFIEKVYDLEKLDDEIKLTIKEIPFTD